MISSELSPTEMVQVSPNCKSGVLITTEEKLQGMTSDISVFPASFCKVTVAPGLVAAVVYIIKFCSEEESKPSAMALPPAAMTVPPLISHTPPFSLPQSRAQLEVLTLMKMFPPLT